MSEQLRLYPLPDPDKIVLDWLLNSKTTGGHRWMQVDRRTMDNYVIVSLHEQAARTEDVEEIYRSELETDRGAALLTLAQMIICEKLPNEVVMKPDISQHEAKEKELMQKALEQTCPQL